MRWRFPDPSNRHEVLARKAVTAKIESWWREFEARADQLHALFKQTADWDLPSWMTEHLDPIDPGLMWEYGPGTRGTRDRLVITPEQRHDLRPLVKTILERAPRITGWEFFEYRLPEDPKTMLVTVKARTECDISDYQVRARRGDHHCIDICYSSPRITDAGDDRALDAAFVATEGLLGEERLDHWIGTVEVTPSSRGNRLESLMRRGDPESRHYIRLDRLKETVESLIGSIREQLPDRPLCERIDEAKWTLWKLDPATADDYVAQQDIFVAKSAYPSAWTAAHSHGLFCSERFSRCGETFCYLKVDGTEGLGDSKFADKADIEDALDAALKPGKLGCQIGGGTGRRYSYVDLALTDVDAGIKAIRQQLQAGGMPKRSWIQFYDTDLAAEWVGIFDDTPAPPLSLDG